MNDQFKNVSDADRAKTAQAVREIVEAVQNSPALGVQALMDCADNDMGLAVKAILDILPITDQRDGQTILNHMVLSAVRSSAQKGNLNTLSAIVGQVSKQQPLLLGALIAAGKGTPEVPEPVMKYLNSYGHTIATLQQLHTPAA